MNKRMEEMRRQQEEAQKEISRARAEAEAAAVARVEAERRAAEERARQEAEAMQCAEENARKRLEAEIKAAEERSQREQEERVRIEEAERYRLMQDDLRRKTEADVLAKVEAEKEAARKATEAEAAASQEHEALKKRIQEAKAKFEEAAKTAEEVAKTAEQLPIKFKDAVGRKFSFPFRLCSTWQGMEELIKQAFLHIDVIGPHVQQGHYDLIGPNNEVILTSVWEKVIEPDWSINMAMWPVEKMPPLGRPKIPIQTPRGPRMPPPPIPGHVPDMPPPDWPGHHRRRETGSGIPAGIDVVNVAPPPASKQSRHNSKRNSTILTFFAGKPTKKSTKK